METIKKRRKCKSGFIFMCSARTKEECYVYRVFGLPRSQLEMVAKIEAGAGLFLFDLDRKLLFGPYTASCNGGANLVPEAFGGRFPSQVKFEITEDCLPVPESVFKDAILDNYTTKFKFKPELSSDQVEKLLSLFRPVGLLDQLRSQVIHNPPHESLTLLDRANSDGIPAVANDEVVVPASNPLVGSSADTSNLLWMPGFIFMCSNKTKAECFVNYVFGMPRKQLELVEKINPGTKLFLFDFDEKLLYGIFNAITRGEANLVPTAFGGKFPAQVKFEVVQDCTPLSESIFKEAILENYTTKFKFNPELSTRQVTKLLSLFLPAGLPGKSHPQLPRDGLRKPPAPSGPAYLPVPAYFPLPGEHFRSNCDPSSSDQYRQQRPTYTMPSARDPYKQNSTPPLSDQYKPSYAPPLQYQYGQGYAFPPSLYEHQQCYAAPPSDQCRQDHAPCTSYQDAQHYVPPPFNQSGEGYMPPSLNQYRHDYASVPLPSDQYSASAYNLGVSNEPQYVSVDIATNANYPYLPSYSAPTVSAANAFYVQTAVQLPSNYPAPSDGPLTQVTTDYPVASTGAPLQVNPFYYPAT